MSDYIQLTAVRGHCLNTQDFIQIAAIRGTPNRSKNPYPMLLNDFYTLCQKNPMNNLGLRKKSLHIHGEIIFKSNDVIVNPLNTEVSNDKYVLSISRNPPPPLTAFS